MAIQEVIQSIIQDKKKLAVVGGGLILVVAIIILLLLSGTNPPPPKTSNLVSQIVLAKSITKDKTPRDPTEVFSVNDPEIYAIISLNNIPAKANVIYQWYDLKARKSIKETTKVSGDTLFTGIVTTSIIRSNENKNKLDWGVGSYDFRVLVNGKIAGSKTYLVQTDEEIEANKILDSIGDVQLTTAVNLDGSPAKSPGTFFSKDDENIFGTLPYNNLATKVTLEGRWTYLNDGRVIDKYQKSIVGTGVFFFGINSKDLSWIPTKKWPIGKYRLEIFLNSEPLESVDFEVQ